MTRTVTNPARPIQEAAVLVPVYRCGRGDLRMVLVRRTEGGVHGGQLAFPGGKCELADASKLDTALRETREEIGIDAGMVEVLEHLPPVETKGTGFRIWPFLARIVPPPTWRRQESEIAEIVDVAIGGFSREGTHAEGFAEFPTEAGPQRLPFYRVGAHRLWGATYRILQPVVPRLLHDEWAL